MLHTPPRQRRAQLPTRIQLIHHQLDELQIAWLPQIIQAKDTAQLSLCARAMK